MITVHIVECYEKLAWQFSHSICCAFVTRNKYAAIHKVSRAYNSVALVKRFVYHIKTRMRILSRCFESHPGNICPSFKTHMWWQILFGTVFMPDYYSEKESNDPKIWMYLICTNATRVFHTRCECCFRAVSYGIVHLHGRSLCYSEN